jgi:hypothetical protein
MEGILLGIEASISPWGVIGGIFLLAIATVSSVFGYAEEEERAGRRLFWAEWPIPESGPPFLEEGLRMAA